MTRIIKAVRNNTKYTSTRAKYEIEIGNILIIIVIILFHDSGHNPSSCLSFKTQRFCDCILPPFSGETYSVDRNSLSPNRSSIYWIQLSRIHLNTDTEFSLLNLVFWTKETGWRITFRTIIRIPYIIIIIIINLLYGTEYYSRNHQLCSRFTSIL
jgi:hypothetical protein